jgi:hypothetical protein
MKSLPTVSIPPASPPSDRSDTLARRIARLRQLMAESSKVATIAEYFDAALVSDDRFSDASKRGENDRLLCFVRGILQARLREARAVRMLLSHLPEHHLWHGAIVLRSGLLVQIIYFEDINRGICSAGTWLNDVVQRFRFSLPNGHHRTDRANVGSVVYLRSWRARTSS